MAEPSAKHWTIDDLDALPEYDPRGWRIRYEIIAGELFVSTAPGDDHQYTCAQITTHLGSWNNATQLGEVLIEPGVLFSKDDAVQPDVIFISHERLARFEEADRHLHGAPELVVEVLSPGAANRRRDLERKLRLYSERDVLEYWAADPRLATVRVYRPGSTGKLDLVATLGRDDTLTSPILPGFSAAVARLFRPAR
ncbi:MAG TPA: Uma2 family endonuclease [Chloroflexota bacterium]|jgi:Uma2 family endonuclease